MLTGPIITNVDPSQGARNAPVTIVEFSDYVCNYCKEQESTIKQLIEAYQDKVRLIWKDYPESNYLSLSFQAAVAARSAGE